MVVHLLATSSWAAPTKTGTTTKQRLSSSEQLGEDAALVRAAGLYDTGQYSLCVDSFEHLLSSDEPRRLRTATKIETARTYHAACLIGVGRTTDAERAFREAILENPQMKAPDGLIFPEAVVEVFLRVRESMLDEIRRAELKRMQDAEARAERAQQLREEERRRVAELVAIAGKETIIERHSRLVATIPFGVGQLQNGQTELGWLFFASETAAAGLFVGSLYMQAYYQTKQDDPKFLPSDINSGTSTAILLQTVSGYSLLGLAAIGIAQAHLAFVPEIRTEQKRVLPDQLTLVPAKPRAVTPALSIRLLPLAGPNIAGAAVLGAF